MIFLTRKAEFSSAHFYWNDVMVRRRSIKRRLSVSAPIAMVTVTITLWRLLSLVRLIRSRASLSDLKELKGILERGSDQRGTTIVILILKLA